MLNSEFAIAKEDTQAHIAKSTEDLLKKKYKMHVLFPVNHTIAKPVSLQITLPKDLSTVRTIKKGGFEAISYSKPTNYSKPVKQGWVENLLTNLSLRERSNAIDLANACITAQKEHENFELLDTQDRSSKTYLYSMRLFKVRAHGSNGVSLLLSASGPYDSVLIQYAIPYYSKAELAAAMQKLKTFKQNVSFING